MPTPKIILETPRLIIREHSLADVEPAYQMNLDPEVSRYTGDGGIVSREEMERRIREDVLGDYQKHGYGRWAVDLRETGEFIGFTGFKFLEDVQETDIGFRYVQTVWGKGIATEAGRACMAYGFEEMGLKRIIGWVLPENAGSIRVLEKLGLSFEKEIMEDGMRVLQYAAEV